MAIILTVVGDEAFSSLLRDGLENLGKHQVIVTHSEKEARRIISEKEIDLVIIDVDLSHIEPVKLVHVMRQIKPAVRIMWMPFLGHELSEEMQAVSVQGILTKPFFMEELPDKIEEALSQPLWGKAPVVAASGAPAPGQEGVLTVEVPISQAVLGPADQVTVQEAPKEAAKQILPPDSVVLETLNRLALELDAESVIVLNRDGDLLAQAGHMNKRQATELASVVTNAVVASSNVAALLKEKSGCFVNSIHEGEQYRLFSVMLPATSLALSVVTRVEIPLGTVRYHVRQAATNLSTMFQDME